MPDAFWTKGIDWRGAGYFGVPAPTRKDGPASNDLEADRELYLTAFRRASVGDFTLIPRLVPVIEQRAPSPLAVLSSSLVGDAGGASSFALVFERATSCNDLEVLNEYMRAIMLRGKLADVRFLLDAYEKYAANEDADIFPVWISELIEEGDGIFSEPDSFGGIPQYRQAIEKRCEEIADRCGSRDVYVYNGREFSVTGLAEFMLDRLQSPYPPTTLRHRFEASTGIDCSRFYNDGQLRPLAAMAILEQFLDGEQAARFQPGVRYFFGHPLEE